MIKAIHPIPAFTDNYIWALLHADGKRVCVVDPGDANPVIDYLERHNLSLTEILVTHHHPDHVGGLSRLVENYAPQVMGPKGSHIKGINRFVTEGDRVSVSDTPFTVLEVPGHTLDHIAYYCDGTETELPKLFCGDTLFAAGCGRLFEGTAAVMHASLAKFTSLPPNTAVYCTHEYTLANLRFAIAADPDNAALQARLQREQEKRDQSLPTLPSSIALELQTNPFLRCQDAALQRSAELQLHHKPENEVEVFAALRRWKDNF
jgi:hydroxyacylglutathione hydrolase